MPEPEKTYRGHGPGQGDEIQDAFALHEVSHTDDGLIALRQAVRLPEGCPSGGIGGEKVGVHPIGQSAHRGTQSIGVQDGGGVGRGGQHQVGLVVTQAEPPLEQRRQQVGPHEGMAEIRLGGMAVPDHRNALTPGPARRPEGTGQHGVQVNHVSLGLPVGHHRDARLFQCRALVVGGLSHAAFAHQGQRTGIDMHTKHRCHLQSPSTFWATTVSPRLYSAMAAGLHRKMMAV